MKLLKLVLFICILVGVIWGLSLLIEPEGGGPFSFGPHERGQSGPPGK